VVVRPLFISLATRRRGSVEVAVLGSLGDDDYRHS
jgi:hypothetical protein